MLSPQKKTVLLNKFRSIKKHNLNSINSQLGIDAHTKTGKHTYVFKKEKKTKDTVYYVIS